MGNEAVTTLTITSDGTIAIEQMGKVVARMKQMQDETQSITDVIKENWKGISAAVYALEKSVSQALQYMDEAAHAMQISSSFKIMADSAGVAADSLISNMKRATQETIADSELMQKAVKLMTLGYDPAQIERFSKVVVTASQIAGTSAAQAYDDLADAIATRMPRALIRMGAVTREQMQVVTAAIKNGASETSLYELAMANLEKKQLMLQGTQDSATIAMQKFHAEMKEFKENIGKWLIVTLDGLYRAFVYAAAGCLGLVSAYARYRALVYTAMGDDKKAQDNMEVANNAWGARNELLAKAADAVFLEQDTGKKATKQQLDDADKRIAAIMKEMKASQDKNKAMEAQKQYDAFKTQVAGLNPLLDQEGKKLNEIDATIAKLAKEGIDKGQLADLRNQAEAYLAQGRAVEAMKKTREENNKVLEAEKKMHEDIARALEDGEIKDQTNLISLEQKRIELYRQAGYITELAATEKKYELEEKLLDIEQKKVNLLAVQMTDDVTNAKNMELYAKQTAQIIDLEAKRNELQRKKVYELDVIQMSNMKKMEQQYQEVFKSLSTMAGNVGGTAGQGLSGAAGSFKGLSDLLTGKDDATKAIKQKREEYRQMSELYANFLGDEFAMLAKHDEMEAAEQQYQQQRKLSIASNTFGMMAGMAQAFYALSGEQSGAAFEIYKGFKIAETCVNTYSAAMAAYNAMAGIPIVGPALGVAAAAAAIAYGMAQVASISSMQPGNSGTAATGYSVPSVSATTTPSTAETAGPSQTQAAPVINIHVYGSVLSEDELARQLVPALKKAVGDGAH